jgi:hypothetical protein
MFTESMAQYLAALNLPSRSDIMALGDRVGELEDTVAGLQVELRHLRRSLMERDIAAQGTEQPTRPKRTKQPPRKARSKRSPQPAQKD